ncbi:MAG: hypothetical protein E6H00_12970 [Bacillati bacterium ANGP1]|uniref:Uncharacterized protein n=1 Tax=Candidatus Segetimicrobium genomatis TaxID=2569760 RepID=A0A537JXS3_9BACT|nr:MAG: hypothetical protein E6H00_12970 [Terrabacteria group bacterium ANGP1]
MANEDKRYQVTVTTRMWDSKSGHGIGFDETTTVENMDFESLLEMLKAFHALTLRFMSAKDGADHGR